MPLRYNEIRERRERSAVEDRRGAMRNGVYIEEGPMNFEIIQQDEDGCADLTWSGYWVMNGAYESIDVYARLLLENSGEEVYTYTGCEISGDRWSVTLRVPAGGLYKFETGLCVNNNPAKSWNLMGDMRHFIGVGDVFVLAGQSNSAGYGLGTMQDPPMLGVHSLKFSRSWQIASHPLGDGTDAKLTESLDCSNLGNSPYIHFGKILFGRLKYPIGLVPTALGGSPISAWNPEEDGVLYRNMLEITRKLTNGYKAVIWYQGCSEGNNKDSKGYKERFERMVSYWRKDSGKPELSFFTAQINKCIRSEDKELNRHWGIVREAQRKAAADISNCYILPTTDVPLSDTIHNSSMGCLMIGERLAHQVLYYLYGIGLPFTSASLDTAEAVSTNRIRLKFTGLVGLLEPFDAPAGELDFTVRDAQGLIGLEGYEVTADSMILLLERDICGSCTVSCGDGIKISRTVPMDKGTYMPILSFYEVAVEQE